MMEDLLAYEMAGQRRCIHAPLRWKYNVGAARDCHIQLTGADLPDVLFSFVRDAEGGIHLLDENEDTLLETHLPLETEVLGMPFFMFQPRHLLESPQAIENPSEHTLQLTIDGVTTPLALPPGQLLTAGCAAEAHLVLPDGPNFSYVFWWDGAKTLHLGVLDSSEGAAWFVNGTWGHQEVVTLPVTLLAGPVPCTLSLNRENGEAGYVVT